VGDSEILVHVTLKAATECLVQHAPPVKGVKY